MKVPRTALSAASVALPLAGLAAVAAIVARDENDIQRERLRVAHALHLDDVASRVATTVSRIESEILGSLPSAEAALTSPEHLREIARTAPFIVQPFVTGDDGRPKYPKAPLTAAESDFLERTRAIWSGDAILYRAPRPESGASTENRASFVPDPRVGWVGWHWQEGLHLLVFRQEPSGSIVGAEVGRIALIAEIISDLERTLPARPAGSVRITLVDARGDAVVHFGGPGGGAHPIVDRALTHPLDSFRIQAFVDDRASTPFGVSFYLGLGALALVVLTLALWAHREQSRDLREAAQRVGFVTQVSHELKTPLTNIRLYAEMLEDEIADEDERARKHLGVIVSESQRLTRLIHNILTFSKDRAGNLRLSPTKSDFDRAVEDSVASAGPSLKEKGIEVSLELGNVGTATFDRDALGQIIANLLSNVEKYARDGRRATIRTGRDSNRVFVEVRDFGPGIDPRHHEAVFAPFFRLEDKINEGAAGTGIGLTIARQLARLSFGELRVMPGEPPGARFRLELPDPPGGRPAQETN
ncbi:MAG: HAMP domain-containing histidine kinase [Deltaproteobacteria bacterium]|nr:HAMP domain-containing histidine kinase [Deltaproteobacteria bacterium]